MSEIIIMQALFCCKLTLMCFVCLQNAEFDLHACQPQLDQMNNKGVQLMEELKNVPNFDVGVMEQDLDEVNVKWENSNKVGHL